MNIIIPLIFSIISTLFTIAYDIENKKFNIKELINIIKNNVYILSFSLLYFGLYLIIITLQREYLSYIDILRLYTLIFISIILSIQDIKNNIIPNKILLISLVIYVISVLFELVFYNNGAIKNLISSLCSLIIVSIIFLLIYFITHKSLGAGDVKYACIIGLYLRLDRVFCALFYGVLICAITGVFLIIMKKKNKKDTLPLAPFLTVGIIIASIWVIN